MGLGLLLIPALGSYWFLTRFDGTRDRMARATGYQVVIRSAIAGLVLFGIARLVVATADWALPQVGALWTRILPIADSGTSALSFVLGMAAAPVFNRLPCFARGKAQRQLAEEEGNLIELLVQDAIDNRRYAELSLQSGKVYIGLPLRSPLASRDQGDIAMIPILSGYRDEPTRQLVLERDYSQAIYSQINKKDWRLEDLRIVVPLREIVSARLFDPAAYTECNAA